MTLRTGGSVEYQAEPKTGILSFFEYLLIAREGISGRFGDAVAGALGARIRVLKCRRIEPGRCFGRGLLSEQANGHQVRTCNQAAKKHYPECHLRTPVTLKQPPIRPKYTQKYSRLKWILSGDTIYALLPKR